MSYAHTRRNQIDFVGHARKTSKDLVTRLRKNLMRTKRKQSQPRTTEMEPEIAWSEPENVDGLMDTEGIATHFRALIPPFV